VRYSNGKLIKARCGKARADLVGENDAIGGDGMTQFGRTLHALNIDIMPQSCKIRRLLRHTLDGVAAERRQLIAEWQKVFEGR
jgi:hypothetical protein